MNGIKEVEDALKEIENMGAGNASRVMSDLIKKEVRLVVPEIKIVNKSDIASIVGGPESMVICMYSPISGDLSGNVVIAFQKKEAFKLIDLLEKKDIGSTELLEDEGKHQLENVGLILIRPYLDPLGEFLDIDVHSGKVRVLSTFGRSLSDFLLLNVKEENTLLITTNFSVPDANIHGDFAFLLAFSSIQTIINAIKSKL
ncbi:MAG: hypothetical protein B6U72_06670 [Candidatus Altiarchaeales archaeon ex4484_2]|nr:MAG: hypothetical protein B6U72_06670 [Candidatus Altiarchaeales archaeon ex4484_2]